MDKGDSIAAYVLELLFWVGVLVKLVMVRCTWFLLLDTHTHTPTHLHTSLRRQDILPSLGKRIRIVIVEIVDGESTSSGIGKEKAENFEEPQN